MKKTVTIGMAGAGRATELHMGAYAKVYGVNVRYKWVFAKQEELASAKERYGFEFTTANFNDLLNDPEVDVIDICTPPYMHAQLIIEALNAGKHVICEKPLTGYFGNPEDERPIGDRVSKVKMYEGCLENIREIEDAIMASDKYFMYAENFVYAPAILKAAEIVQAKKSRILYMKGEESLKGSSSPVAGEWEKTGGGTFIRTGTHPLSAILWLKQQEAKARNVEIKVKSVVADMARITPSLSDYEHRHIAARPHDVEDCGTVIIEFSDGTRAVVIATDTLLGGSKNYVELYCNDAAIYCTLTLNNLMSTYFLDEDGLDNVPISEMLPSKTGWNNPFVSDEIIRGYTNEIQDFMEAVAYNREPKSGFQLAKDTVKVIYAAYLSAEQGKKIEL